MSPTDPQPAASFMVQSVADLTALANAKHHQGEEAVGVGLAHFRDAGHALLALKAKLPPGEFGEHVRRNMKFSYSTARVYMRVAGRWEECKTAKSLRGAASALSAAVAEAAASEPSEDVDDPGGSAPEPEESESLICDRCLRHGRPVPNCPTCKRLEAEAKERKKQRKKRDRAAKRKAEKVQSQIEYDPDVRFRKALADARKSARLAADDMRALLEFPQAVELIRGPAEKYGLPLDLDVASDKPGRPTVLRFPGTEWLPDILGEVAKAVKADGQG